MLKDIITFFNEYSWATTIIRILLAAVLGGIIGYERGRHGRAAGFRTHIILCVGSCLSALVGIHCAEALSLDVDPLRIAAQVVSGIGFLGAGAIILKNKVTITGLTTAAGMWTTAVIGIAAGSGFYVGAILATILLYSATTFFTMFEKSRKAIINFYVEIEDARHLNDVVDGIKALNEDVIDIQIQESKANIKDSVALLVTIDNSKKSAEILKDEIRKIDSVIFVLAQ